MKKALIITSLLFFLNCLLLNAQNVGIGTTAPAQELHVVSGTGSADMRLQGAGYPGCDFFSGVNAGVWSHGNRPLLFATNNTERIYLSGSGLVGIGTNAPSGLLHVNNSFYTGNGWLNVLERNPTGAGGAIRLKGSNGNIDWMIDNDQGVLRFYKNGYESAVLKDNGVLLLGIGTGTHPAGYRLICRAGILAERVKIAVFGTSQWADYVFDESYALKPLEEVDQFIKTNHHLPNIPSAEEMVETGNDLGKTDALLLAKIEELFLYTIEMNDKVKNLTSENIELKEQMKALNKELKKMKKTKGN